MANFHAMVLKTQKIQNMVHSVALNFFHYNFCRKHETLEGKTPAQAAGVDKFRWTIDDIVDLADAYAEQKRIPDSN